LEKKSEYLRTHSNSSLRALVRRLKEVAPRGWQRPAGSFSYTLSLCQNVVNYARRCCRPNRPPPTHSSLTAFCVLSLESSATIAAGRPDSRGRLSKLVAHTIRRNELNIDLPHVRCQQEHRHGSQGRRRLTTRGEESMCAASSKNAKNPNPASDPDTATVIAAQRRKESQFTKHEETIDSNITTLWSDRTCTGSAFVAGRVFVPMMAMMDPTTAGL
jgi:hypothetical protein